MIERHLHNQWIDFSNRTFGDEGTRLGRIRFCPSLVGTPMLDHPSFAPAVIGRYLESKGYRVGIIDQPDWNDVEVFKTW